MTRTGRPREFDITDALETAMTMFWRDGYGGASLNQIAAAIGVGKPSLYAAFGDKEHLYLRALAHYGARLQGHYADVLEAEPDARRAIEALLFSAIESVGHGAMPGGCMVVAGAATCDADGVPASVRHAISDALHARFRAIEQRLERGKREQQLPASAVTTALASFYSTVHAGLVVQAQDRRCSRGLKEAVSAAMAAWPRAASKARTRRTRSAPRTLRR